MPLLDHFQPPLSAEFRWESFYSSWATKIADALGEEWLPPNYIAEEHVDFGPSTAANPRVWTTGAPSAVMPAAFPETFEVRVLSTDTGPKLVAAIELISPGNKDRATERRGFAAKCASYLYQGVSLIIVDTVTSRRANLHNEILRVMEAAQDLYLSADVSLYATAYQPLRHENRDEISIWHARLALGQPLPTLPLALRADLIVPVDFEKTYVEVCQRKRLTDF
jgi:hypothetical protein